MELLESSGFLQTFKEDCLRLGFSKEEELMIYISFFNGSYKNKVKEILDTLSKEEVKKITREVNKKIINLLSYKKTPVGLLSDSLLKRLFIRSIIEMLEMYDREKELNKATISNIFYLEKIKSPAFLVEITKNESQVLVYFSDSMTVNKYILLSKKDVSLISSSLNKTEDEIMKILVDGIDCLDLSLKEVLSFIETRFKVSVLGN